jgi:hypothetical protein
MPYMFIQPLSHVHYEHQKWGTPSQRCCGREEVEDVANGVIWQLGYVKQSCWHHLGAGLCEPRLVASFGGWYMWTKAVGIVWGLGYVKWSCLLCLGACLCETKLLELFGGCFMWTKASCIIWGLVYVNQGCSHHLRAWLCEMKLLVSFGTGLCEPRLVALFGGWYVYVHQGCRHHLRAQLCEMKLLANTPHGSPLCSC